MFYRKGYLAQFFIIITYIFFILLTTTVINNRVSWAQMSDEERIQICIEDFLEGIRLGDIDRFMKNISENFLRVSREGKFVDKSKFKQEVLALWEKFALVSLDDIEMDIYIVGNKAGVLLRCRFTGELLSEHKKKKVYRYYFLLFEKENEIWKLISWYDLPTKKEGDSV